MRTISMNDMVDIALDMFNEYVEPVASSFMYGEVPTSTIMIHRTGTYDHDFLTKVRFKNTTSISIFRCEIYMQDVLNFCRTCKFYLVTPEIFTTVITYSMLFPLYQSQHMDFDKVGVDVGYDQMMTESGHDTYRFMLKHFDFPSKFNRHVILDTIHYTIMNLNQTYKYFPKDKNIYETLYDLHVEYDYYMMKHHNHAYRASKQRKAQDYLVDDEGFIRLDRINKGGVNHEDRT